MAPLHTTEILRLRMHIDWHVCSRWQPTVHRRPGLRVRANDVQSGVAHTIRLLENP